MTDKKTSWAKKIKFEDINEPGTYMADRSECNSVWFCSVSKSF